MSKASPAMQQLAHKLFAIEAGHANNNESQANSFVRVCEKLRMPLTKFAGPVGYSSLLSRALALAQVECPDLTLITIGADGSLKVPSDSHQKILSPDHDSIENPEVIVVAHLLGLLATFIGESLMITLLSDAWPSESFDTVDPRSEVKP